MNSEQGYGVRGDASSVHGDMSPLSMMSCMVSSMAASSKAPL